MTNMHVIEGGKGSDKANGQSSDFERLKGIQTVASSELKPYYYNNASGVYYVGIKQDKNGNIFTAPPVYLSAQIELIGRGIGEDDKEYRIIQYRRRNEKTLRQAVVPMEYIGDRDCLRLLLGLGITVKSGGTYNALLFDYLQSEGSLECWQIVNRAGWLNEDYSAYILPNGEVIGASGIRVIYNGDAGNKEAYAVSGSLAEWQNKLARYCVGNSRILLAVGAAFAGTLLAPMKLENGGFHLYQASSGGKTTTALVSLTVFGNPEELKYTWKGTGYGFDNAALSSSDGFMVLDEVSQAKPGVVYETAYSLCNGVGKIQGAKQGGNRERKTWRIMALSTGEFDLASYMKSEGENWNAGQNVRFPSISADTNSGFRVFDTVHDMDDGTEFAESLEAASKRYYGTAGRAFLKCLAEAMKANKVATITRIQALMDEFMAQLPELDSQPRRVAKRFALVAAALELATQYGVTGFVAGVGMAGIKSCFDAWLEQCERGNYEERQILKNAEDWFQRFAESERFTELSNFGNREARGVNHDHCGFLNGMAQHQQTIISFAMYLRRKSAKVSIRDSYARYYTGLNGCSKKHMAAGSRKLSATVKWIAFITLSAVCLGRGGVKV